MSRIDELIKEKCPNGVEYRMLGELGRFYGGLTGKSKDDFKDGNAIFITYKNVYSNPALDMSLKDRVKISEGEKQHTLEYGDIIFTGSSETPEECGFSSVVTQKTNKKLYLNSFCFFFRLDDTSFFCPDFAKHLFRSNKMRKQIIRTASGVTRFNISKKLMAKVKVPVIPLDVQKDISVILNSMSELEAELEAELTKRKQQYEYYRDHLLSFENIAGEGGRVEWLALGDVCILVTGATPSRTNHSYWDGGTIPWMNSGEVNLRRVFKTEEKITEDGYNHASTTIVPKHSIVIALAGQGKTRGKVAITEIELCTNQSLCSIICGEKINYKYLFHYLDSKYENLRSISNGDGTRGGLSLRILSPYKIPVPTLDVQEKIVYVLDNFDAVCNDLNIGLPAEIEARQKQYEYYRDRLLSFDAVIGDGIERERERERGVAKLRQYIFGYYIAKIEDICDISRGIVMSKDFIKDNTGDYPVYSSQTENDGMLGKINTYKYDGEYLTWTTDGANAGTVFRRSGKFSVTNVCGLLKIKEEGILNDYLYYALSVEAKKHVSSGMGNPKLMSNVMGSIKAIIPSAEQQESIIKVLNNLSEICESFKSGLPAEIEARHKQYEYYRDKLLTFSEK